jgi:hypothetical protein
MAGSDSGREPVKVLLPADLPVLTPGAARALLRILVKAREKQDGDAYEALGAPEALDGLGANLHRRLCVTSAPGYRSCRTMAEEARDGSVYRERHPDGAFATFIASWPRTSTRKLRPRLPEEARLAQWTTRRCGRSRPSSGRLSGIPASYQATTYRSLFSTATAATRRSFAGSGATFTATSLPARRRPLPPDNGRHVAAIAALGENRRLCAEAREARKPRPR